MTALDMFPETKSAPEELPDDRYTTRETLTWCARAAGVAMFDLDVAACKESHKAGVWFGIDANGLEQEWFGRVWCNPPYSDIRPWVQKAFNSVRFGKTDVVAQLLPANRTEQPWWQELVEPIRDTGPMLKTYFLPGRTRFGFPGNPEGVGVGSPPFSCVLLVWRQT